MAQTKPPLTPRRVFAADLTVEVGGETYRPHEDEFVEFKGRPSVGLFVTFAQLGDSPEAIELLLEYLVAWNWTDDEGRAYVSPPTRESLLRLPPEELTWLLTHVASEPTPEEASKNGSSSSPDT